MQPRGRNLCNVNSQVIKKAYSGEVTQGARKRIAIAVNLMLLSTPWRKFFNPILKKEVSHRLSFITLTISCSDRLLSASEAYTMLLKPFLQWLTITAGAKKYIWKAELQKRGQIHYHVTTDLWLNYTILKEKWNYLQKKNGLLKEYFETKGHFQPNSTDIRSVKNLTNIEAYLTKYLAKKGSENDITIGKIWDCSKNLKGKKYPSLELTESIEKAILRYQDYNGLDEWSNEHCTILSGKPNMWKKILTIEQKEIIYNLILDINK